MTDTTPETERWTLDEPAFEDEAPAGDLEDCVGGAGGHPDDEVEGMDGVDLPGDDEVESMLGIPDDDEGGQADG